MLLQAEHTSARLLTESFHQFCDLPTFFFNLKRMLSAHLFVELIASHQSILDGVLVIGGMEVEEVYAVSLQPL